MDPQTALDVPRFCILDGTANGVIAFEGTSTCSFFFLFSLLFSCTFFNCSADGYSVETLKNLQEMGHNAHPAVLTKYERSTFGNGQIITRDPQSTVLCGGSDLRADGLAIAWS